MNWYDLLKFIERQRPTFDLSVGSPCVPPLLVSEISHIIQDIAMSSECTKVLGQYTDLDGVYELRARFADRCTVDFGEPIDPIQVLATPGAQASLRYIQELVERQGRRLCYPVGIEFPGAVPVQNSIIPSIGYYCTNSFKPNVSEVFIDFASIDWSNVGAAILSRPHNPTGRIWEVQTILDLAADAAKCGAYVVLDETYGLPYAPLSSYSIEPVHAPNIIHIYSFSKVGLASERVGIMVCPLELIRELRPILRNNIIQAPKLGQYLALKLIESLESSPNLAKCLGEVYAKRWEQLSTTLFEEIGLDGPIRVGRWDGGPFLWCDWRDGINDLTVFKRMLDLGVAVTPASTLWITANDSSANSVNYWNGIRVGLGGDDIVAATPPLCQIFQELFGQH